MRSLIASFVLALFLAALPVKADTFSIVGNTSFSDVILAGGSVIRLGTVETINTAFIYNSESQAVSDMNFNSNGPLGPFSFAGVQGTRFEWIGAQADLFLFPPSATPIPILATPLFASGFQARPFWLDCTTDSCLNDFGGHNPLQFIGQAGFATATLLTPTPEPASLILFGIGLIAIAFMSRRLITS